MSLTPIFDAVLADSEPDIFLAGLVFPRPTMFTKGGLIGKPVTLANWNDHWPSKPVGQGPAVPHPRYTHRNGSDDW